MATVVKDMDTRPTPAPARSADESALVDADLAALLADAPIFQQPWWLEAVAPGRWDHVVARRGQEIAAAMPIVRLKAPLGLREFGMPPLTQTLGPWLRASDAKYAQQLARQKELMTELIDALPPHHHFAACFDPSVTNWLPFYWRGFQQTTRYTYVLDDLTDLDAVWAGLRTRVRGDIRKARKRVHVTDEPDIERFMDLNEKTFARQGLGPRHSRDLIRRLDAACAEHDARRMFFAEDDQGRTHAGVYLVWTPRTATYLMGGGDPELRSSGATSLAIWEAIRFAATVSERFDFEGSMVEPIERFVRSFGARQAPFFEVSRTTRAARLLRPMRRVVGRVKRLGSRLARAGRSR